MGTVPRVMGSPQGSMRIQNRAMQTFPREARGHAGKQTQAGAGGRARIVLSRAQNCRRLMSRYILT